MTVPITASSRTAAALSDWRALCWSPELNIAVAISNSSEATNLMTSTDGVTWTGASAGAGSWESVCWSPELALFVVVGTMQISTSPDGVTWTARTPPSGTWLWKSVCWSKQKSLFVAVASAADSGTRVITSPDGITWALRTTPADNSWVSITYGDSVGLFVAVAADGTSGNQIMTSPDGTTWTSRSVPTARAWKYVCWSPTKKRFVAVTGTSIAGVPSVIYSTDGINWYVPAAPKIVNQGWAIVLWQEEIDRFIAWNVNTYSFSEDGLEWDSPATVSISANALCWAPQIAKLLGTFNSGVIGSRASEVAFKKVNATIVESLVASRFKFCAVGTKSSSIAGKASTSTGAVTIPLNTDEPVMVLANVDQGPSWEGTKAYSVGDTVIPTNSSSSPWYYKATIGGVSGSTEPTWPNTLVPFTDGSVTWVFQEQLVKPIANGPLMPV